MSYISFSLQYIIITPSFKLLVLGLGLLVETLKEYYVDIF